jgi:hypothetical protein
VLIWFIGGNFIRNDCVHNLLIIRGQQAMSENILWLVKLKSFEIKKICKLILIQALRSCHRPDYSTLIKKIKKKFKGRADFVMD